MVDRLVTILSAEGEPTEIIYDPPAPPVVLFPSGGYETFSGDLVIHGTAENNTRITIDIIFDGGMGHIQEEVDTVAGKWYFSFTDLDPYEYSVTVVAYSYASHLTGDPTTFSFEVLAIPDPFAAFHVPPHTYEWNFDVNNAIPLEGSFINQNRRLLLTIKDMLVQVPDTPWEVVGSCDGVSYGLDGIDRWTTLTDIVFTSLPGEARSWIVLKQPALYGGFYLLIECESPSFPAYKGLRICASATPFIGGDTLCGPSSPTEVLLKFDKWGFSDNQTTSDLVVHLVHRVDGRGFKLIITYQGLPQDFWMIDVPLRTVSGLANPWVGMAYYRENGACRHTTGWRIGSALKMGIGTEGFDASAVCEMLGATHPSDLHNLNPHSITNRWPLVPISVGSDGADLGIHAFLADLWWGGSGHPIGSTYVNSDAERVWAQFQHLVIPWDHSIPIDANPERVDIDGEPLPSYLSAIGEVDLLIVPLAISSTQLQVTFSDPVVDNAALRSLDNYEVTPHLDLLGIEVTSPTTVVLTTSEQRLGEIYTCFVYRIARDT